MKPISTGLHYIGVIFCASSAAVIVVVIAAMIWLSTAPREVPFLKELLIRKIAMQDLVQDAQIISLKAYLNVETLELEAQADAFNIELPGGDISIETVRLSSPLQYILHKKLGFDVLLFDDVHINVRNHPNIHIPSFYIEPEAGNIKQTHIAIDLSQVAQGARVSGLFEIHDSYISATMNNEHIPLSLLALLGKDFMGVSGYTTGKFYVSFGKDGVVQYADTTQDITDITYKNQTLYPKTPLTLDYASFKADWKHKNSEVTLSEFTIMRDKAICRGDFYYSDTDMRGSANIKMLPINMLKILAPETKQGKESREWVRTHLFDGMIDKGSITFSNDVENPFKAILHMSAMRAVPSPKIPPLYHVSGVTTVTQDTLRSDIHHAKTLNNTILKKGTIAVKSFARGAAPMDVKIEVDSNAKDVATFLLPKYLNKAQKLNLKPDMVQGDVEGTASLSFPLYPDRAGLGNSSFDHVTIDVAAQLRHVSHPALLGDLPVRNMAGTLKLNNDEVHVAAEGLLHNTPAIIDATHIYAEGKADTDYEATLHITDGNLDKFNIPISQDYVQGVTTLHAKASENSVRQHIDATLDFSKAALNIDTLNWSKPIGKAATLKVQQYKADGVNKIKSLEFLSDTARAKGSLVLNEAGALQSASFSELSFHNNMMALDYEEGTFPIINLTASQFYAPESKSGKDEQPFDFLLGKRINADIDIFYYKGVPFKDVRLRSVCSNALCSSLSLNTMHHNHRIDAQIKKDNTGRMLGITIDDAGALLTSLDIMDYMKNGALSFTGYYQDDLEQRPIKGMVTVKKMKIVGVPFLTKIFTLASLRGLSDTLLGKGIAFDKTTADILYDRGDIHIEKLAAKGDAVGVMVHGDMSINTPQTINIEGTLIPSYALNSLPGKVPLIGEILVGGEGEGVFGTRFSAKGALVDPNVSANPLSMLTPGFLRNIFNIFPDVDTHHIQEKESPYGGRHQP